MKQRIALLSCLSLLVFGSASYAEGARPYIGIELDPAPLPELLTKHLGLEAGQGIRIVNITVTSPADKAGLERDDIITAFQGKAVSDPEQVVEAVRKLEVGAQVSLDVIHLGQRKNLQLELASVPDDGKLKYPPEPESVMSWRPGRLFKVGPGGRDWMEIPFDKIPELNFKTNKLFKEFYTYHHSADGEDYTITIEGSPEDPQSRVIVRSGQTEYSTTRDNLEALPEKYRGPAKEALDSAQTNARKDIFVGGKFRLPEPPSPEAFRKYFDNFPRPDMERWSEQKDRAVQMLQEQMERLQQRVQEMEKSQQEMLDRVLKKMQTEKEQPAAPEKPAPAASADKHAI
jgi:hypothetical protein